MFPDTGILIICILACFHQAKSNIAITGYVGESVTLRSGADSSWNLSRIQWSIYSNTTYIALLDEGTVEVKFWRYKDRLELDKTSGDLKIQNLTAEDSMKYTVGLWNAEYEQQENHILLTVVERPRKPKITVLSNSMNKEYCVIGLKCSLSQENIILSWTLDQGFTGSVWTSNESQNSRELVLWTSFTSNEDITFYCKATNSHLSETENITLKCSDIERKTSCPECRRSCKGVVAAIIIFVTMVLLIKYIDEIKTWIFSKMERKTIAEVP